MRLRDYWKLFWKLKEREKREKELQGTTKTEFELPMTKMQKRLHDYKDYLIYLFNKK
jgi:hypothetical protein